MNITELSIIEDEFSQESISLFVKREVAPAQGGLAIRAENDTEAIKSWLSRYIGKGNSFVSAQNSVSRFAEWLSSKGGIKLSEVTNVDLQAYLEFLEDPQPRAYWVTEDPPIQTEEQRKRIDAGEKISKVIGKKREERVLRDGTRNEKWRPFIDGLNPSSIRLHRSHINALYEFLRAAGYLNTNPVKLLMKAKKIKVDRERYLSVQTVQMVRSFLESKAAQESDQQPPSPSRWYTRALFVFELFYYSALRISEAASLRMGDLYKEETGYWIHVVGKGDKEGKIPVPDEFLRRLIEYRSACGLTNLPFRGESTPLVMDAYGKGKKVTSKAINEIFKRLFEEFAQSCQDPDIKAEVSNASAHFMRHTSASHQLNHFNMPLKVVSENLRHSDLSTTSGYSHIEDKQRFEESKKMGKL